jgi:hypothetical protein
MTTMDNVPIEVYDSGSRVVRFVGHELAHVSSQRPSAPRWTELTLYRTIKDLFIVYRVGKSRVYHTDHCAFAQRHKLPYYHEKPEQSIAELTPCELCAPHRQPQNDNAMFRVEVNRQWTGVADNASGAIELLYRTDYGRKSMPMLAASLLTAAAKVDPDIRNAYSVVNL